MNYQDINVTDGLNQKEVYEEFKKYCKLASESVNEYGIRTLHVTNGNPDSYYSLDVEFMPKESQLETIDRIFVQGYEAAGFTLESLLKIGYERLGENAFNTKEQVDELNKQINAIKDINVSSHIK